MLVTEGKTSPDKGDRMVPIHLRLVSLSPCSGHQETGTGSKGGNGVRRQRGGEPNLWVPWTTGAQGPRPGSHSPLRVRTGPASSERPRRGVWTPACSLPGRLSSRRVSLWLQRVGEQDILPGRAGGLSGLVGDVGPNCHFPIH